MFGFLFFLLDFQTNATVSINMTFSDMLFNDKQYTKNVKRLALQVPNKNNKTTRLKTFPTIPKRFLCDSQNQSYENSLIT